MRAQRETTYFSKCAIGLSPPLGHYLPDEVIKPLRQGVASRACVPEPPFSDKRGDVAGALEHRSDGRVGGLQRPVRAVIAADGAMALVLAHHQSAAAGRADGARVRAAKRQAVVRERLDVWGGNGVRAVHAVAN